MAPYLEFLFESVLLVRYYGFIQSAGGFIVKDLRKFLGLNKTSAHFMGQVRISRKEIKACMGHYSIKYSNVPAYYKQALTTRRCVVAYTCTSISRILLW